MAYQVTSLGISVLALLRERPMHGYEMFQTLEVRHEDRILKVRPGSLYHVINRLSEEKLIRQTSTGRRGNRPERTTYELTNAGAEALAQLLRELVASPVHEFEKFVVALAEIHHLDRATAVQALRRRISSLQDIAAELQALPSSGNSSYRAALDYLAATTLAKLAWLEQFASSLEREERDTKPLQHEAAP
jgi:DNA-binding PadR family transcriptional regulator